MSERSRGVLAFVSACLVIASVALFSWRLALGVAGVAGFVYVYATTRTPD